MLDFSSESIGGRPEYSSYSEIQTKRHGFFFNNRAKNSKQTPFPFSSLGKG